MTDSGDLKRLSMLEKANRTLLQATRLYERQLAQLRAESEARAVQIKLLRDIIHSKKPG